MIAYELFLAVVLYDTDCEYVNDVNCV